MRYFPEARQVRGDARKIIASRYMDANPPEPYTFRPFTTAGVVRGPDYRYDMDLTRRFPDAPLHSVCYLWGRLPSVDGSPKDALLIPHGPAQLYVNGRKLLTVSVQAERFATPISVTLPLKKGNNSIVLCFEKTVAGFGGEFGTWLGKLDYYFLLPKKDEEGFLVSRPLEHRLDDLSPMALRSLPWIRETNEGPTGDVFGRLFPTAKEGQCAVALVTYTSHEAEPLEVNGADALLVDGATVPNHTMVDQGTHQMMIASIRKGERWGFVIKGKGKCSNALLTRPCSLAFCYAGPFSDLDTALASIRTDDVFETTQGVSFWRLDQPESWVRMYNDNPLFGHWNYPLGVTLYGLCMTERAYRSEDPAFADRIHAYLNAHLGASISTYRYALWDKAHLGGATAVHHLMTSLDSLDDCGSFCSTLLEIAKDHELPDYAPLVDAVAEHILHHQARLEDGTFYRKDQMHSFHNGTMWADDLYMSVPFLVRYAAYTHDLSVLDDAARQFLGFAKRLYLPEKQLFSHVYDLKRGFATGIPWGRGNGWVLFSLSELLMNLTPSHPQYTPLLGLFRSLSQGFLKVQGANGMWHQVLDMPDSYEEASCTAMFAASYFRGVRFGWLEDNAHYLRAAEHAVSALQSRCIDTDGHLYGVCRGSEFSFSPDYYAHRLLPRLDDTHGIGIVLIALDEAERSRA
jgi:rhamnogalacturonyl hydrolase YesR